MEGRPDMMTRPCNGQGTRRKNCHTIGRGSSSEKPAFYSGSDTTAETAGCFPSLLSHCVLLNRKTVSTGLRSPFPALRDSASFLLLSFVTLLSCSSLFHVSPLSPWFLGTPPLTSIAAQAAVLPTPSAPPTVPSPLGPQKDFCATSRQRLLVLHDNPNVENKFSSLFRRLREGHGFKISFVSFPLSHDRNPRLLLQQRGEAVFDHVLLLADNHRPFSNELSEALTSFFDSAATEEEKTPVFPPSSPLESRGRFCPSATRARNVFLMIHPSAHASVHAFVAEFMGVERQGETPSVQKKRGSEVFVVDYFNALKGYPRKTDNSSEDADEGYEDDEADGTIFKTRNLIPDQPHVVEPLREDEILLYRGGGYNQPLAFSPSPRSLHRRRASSHLPMSSRPKSLSSVEEDEQHFVLLRAPSTAFRSSKEDTSRRTSSPMLWGREDAHEEEEEEDRREKSDRSGNDFVGGTDLALATAFQASHNGRGIVLASTEFCSDDVMRLGAEVSSDDFLVNDGAPEDGNEHKNLKIANLRVCEDLLLWALNRRGVLRYSNLKHFKPGESVSPHLYRMQDTITFSIDLHQLSEEGSWHPFYAGDVQVEFVMLEPFLRFFLEPPRSPDSPTFSWTFQSPDRYGVFKFVLHYNRLGFSVLHVESLAPLRSFKSNEFPRFLPCALPYYCCSLLTLVGLIIFIILFLLHQEGKEPSPLPGLHGCNGEKGSVNKSGDAGSRPKDE